MASATTYRPSSSSSSSNSNSNSSYDVFLSFRGEDTRYTFTDHLYQALKDHGINTFRDDEGLNRGVEIAPELLKVIEAAKFSIVVFSENYAYSNWCLEEVAKIMECQKERSQTVIPIFYHVDPSEQVRKQGGSYGKAFALHEKDADEEKRKKIQKWRSALSDASNLAGYHVAKNEYESKHIKEITNMVLESLNPKLMSLEKFIVGMDSHKKNLKQLLRIHHIVGIYGIGGSGKTTIAKIIYNDILFEFNGGSFLQNVKQEFEKGHQLQLLQQLLCDMMRRDIMLRTVNDGMNMIKGKLHSKKVLIIIDDVDNSDQLELLAGSLEWFGTGSKIIITTRNQQLLSKCRENTSSYEIKMLDYDNALQLFCWHAFGQKKPKENYENLSKCIVDYAQGLPLALKVLGGFLCSKSIVDEWKSALDKLKNNLDKDIDKVLRISFEGLDKFEKEVFLDIACFFKDEDKDFTSEILDNCDLYGKIGISVLISKCLITISDNNTIGMHDLIQQMGWTIVREKSPDNPYKGSRLWDPKDIHYVFSKKEEIKNVEVISYDLSKIKDVKVNAQVFTKMKKLRLLKVYRSSDYGTLILPKDFDFFSQELRYLYWETYPLKTLPSNFQGENLTRLFMQGSNIKQLWSESQILGRLKVIDLSYSRKLIKMPKFWTMPNLEILNLDGCASLRKLDPSIGDLKKLTFLDLGRCKQLGSLPNSIDELESLEFLSLDDCQQLKKFPEIGDNMRCLRGSGIKDLPCSIQYLTSLEVLLLSPYPIDGRSFHFNLLFQLPTRTKPSSPFEVLECKSLQGNSGIKEVPSSIEYLTSLEVLSLNGCKNLEKFPEIHGNIGCLRMLDLGGSGIKELPSSFKYLTSLEYLNLSYCSNFEKFPEIFGNMRRLRKLILENSGIKELPRSIGGLESLEILNLRGCRKFEIFPDIQGNMKSLRHLDLENTAMKELPRCIDCLESLEILDLRGCVKLEKFPEIQRNMGNLWRIELDGITIKEIPSSIDHLTGLRLLVLRNLKSLRSLPSSIFRMKSPKSLILHGCSNLQKLPENLRGLPCYLEELSVTGCKLVGGEIPNDFWSLSSLRILNVSGSDIRSIPAGIVELSKLTTLIMKECKLLEEITELPSSLREIGASGCPRLDTSKFWSSGIKCCKSVVEEFECYCPYNRIEIVLPGNNGIPQWVRHKNRGGEVTIDLPPNWYTDNSLFGFAFFFNINGGLDPQNRYFGSVNCQLMISASDQFEWANSFDVYCGGSYSELVVRYVPKIAILGNHGSNEWRKLKAYLSFYRYDVCHGKSYEETFPAGTCERVICGIHLIYAEVGEQQNEKHFLKWLRENENTTRKAKRKRVKP